MTSCDILPGQLEHGAGYVYLVLAPVVLACTLEDLPDSLDADSATRHLERQGTG